MPTTPAVEAAPDSVARLEPLIRENIAWNQRERKLSPAVVDAFHDEGLFRLTIPKHLGGAGLNDLEFMPLVEAVSRIDASTGWNLSIANGITSFARLVSEEAACTMLSEPRSLIAGAANPAGIRVRRTDGGFVFDGTGPFASGCSQASWLGAGGILMSEKGPVMGEDGLPTVLMGFVPAEKVTILDTWRVTGLRGTGSHDLRFDNVFVPDGWVGNLRDTSPRALDPYAAIPLTSRLPVGLASVAFGATEHAISELQSLSTKKMAAFTRSTISARAEVQIALSRATGLVAAARALCESVMGTIGPKAAAGKRITIEDLVALRQAFVTATELTVEAVDIVHNAAGTSTLDEDSVIGLCWRDVHAVSNHTALQSKHHESLGQVMLGLPPSAPI